MEQTAKSMEQRWESIGKAIGNHVQTMKNNGKASEKHCRSPFQGGRREVLFQGGRQEILWFGQDQGVTREPLEWYYDNGGRKGK